MDEDRGDDRERSARRWTRIDRSHVAQRLSSRKITLIKDSYYDAESEIFSLGDYTLAVQNVGTIAAHDPSEITLTVGNSRYVFALTGTTATYPAMMNSMVTEGRLAELGYVFRFFQDNMGFAALEASELPPGFYDDPTTTLVS